MDLYTVAISKNTLVSTIYNLTNKGFQVLLTKNSKDTAFFILQFAKKMKKEICEKEKSHDKCNTIDVIETQSVSYENTEGVVQTKKNKNITKDNISVFMLCQIPGISTKTAGILLEKYGHVSKLIIAMKENINEIEEFKVNDNDKKLNKNIIKNLNEYLRVQH